MKDRDESRRISMLIGGGLLLLVGGLLVSTKLGIVQAGSIGDYWPMLLVWVGATKMLAPNGAERFASGAIVLALGVFFQLEQFDWIDVSIGDFWPAFLILGGLAMVVEGLRARRHGSQTVPPGAAESEGRT